MTGQGFPRAIRLRRSADFGLVQQGGRSFACGPVVVCWRPRPEGSPRFGLAVGRKVGGAVVRNRVKRWLREAIRRERADIAGVDVVFIARASAHQAGFGEIHRRVGLALRRIEGLR